MNGPVLITGASGFAGSHLLELLSGQHELVAWGRSSPAPELLPLARWHQVELLDRDRVRALIRELRPAAVYHCAGSPHVPESFSNTVKPFANNVLATHHLFDALRRADVRSRLLLIGSAAVYGSSDSPLTEESAVSPASPYAHSKLAQEQLGLRAIREDGLDVIVTRPFNHTGARQTAAFMAPAMAQQIASIERGRHEPVLRVGNTSAIRDLSDVRDVVRAYAALMRSGATGTIYNVASGTGHSVQEVLDALIARAKVAVRIEIDPGRLRPGDSPRVIGNATRLQEATGWRPEITFERMIDDLLQYWRTHHNS